MSNPITRPGWRHRPATGGHAEAYERAEGALRDGAALSIEVVANKQDPRYWSGILRLLGGNAGNDGIMFSLVGSPDAAMAAMEGAALALGQRLIELGTPQPAEGGVA